MRNEDRRRDPRVPFATCATLWLGAAEIGVYRIVDLSAGGALIEGRCPAPVGYALTANFHLAGFEIPVAAVVARNENPRVERFAIRFEAMLPEAREWIRALVQEVREPAYDAADLVVMEATYDPDLFQFPTPPTDLWEVEERQSGVGG
ncbi:MAG TPA: PilZ domain-containing protein [Polyangia bacterium]